MLFSWFLSLIIFRKILVQNSNRTTARVGYLEVNRIVHIKCPSAVGRCPHCRFPLRKIGINTLLTLALIKLINFAPRQQAPRPHQAHNHQAKPQAKYCSVFIMCSIPISVIDMEKKYNRERHWPPNLLILPLKNRRPRKTYHLTCGFPIWGFYSSRKW